MLQTILHFDLGIGFCSVFFVSCQLGLNRSQWSRFSPGRGFETPKSGLQNAGTWVEQSKRFLSSKFQLEQDCLLTKIYTNFTYTNGKTNMAMEEIHHDSRCISYWKRWISIAMLPLTPTGSWEFGWFRRFLEGQIALQQWKYCMMVTDGWKNGTFSYMILVFSIWNTLHFKLYFLIFLYGL